MDNYIQICDCNRNVTLSRVSISLLYCITENVKKFTHYSKIGKNFNSLENLNTRIYNYVD